MRIVMKIHHPSEDPGITGRPYTFDMHAGERIWVLASDSDEDLRSWMKQLCKATKMLKLEDHSSDGNVILTTVNPKAELTSRLSTYKSSAGGRGGKIKKGKKKFKKGRRASAKPGAAGF